MQSVWYADAVEDLNGGHHRTELSQRGWERTYQHLAAIHSQQAFEHVFTCNKEPLERVEVFKYLGRLIAFNHANPRSCGAICKRHVGVGVCCGLKMLSPDVQDVLHGDRAGGSVVWK